MSTFKVELLKTKKKRKEIKKEREEKYEMKNNTCRKIEYSAGLFFRIELLFFYFKWALHSALKCPFGESKEKEKE